MSGNLNRGSRRRVIGGEGEKGCAPQREAGADLIELRLHDNMHLVLCFQLSTM